MNAQLKHYAELIEAHKFKTLLLYLSISALELRLQGEDDHTRRELIEGEINARATKD
jgi:hypothetical protein